MKVLEPKEEDPIEDYFDFLGLINEYIVDLIGKHVSLVGKHVENICCLEEISLEDIPKKDAELCLSAILTYNTLVSDFGNYKTKPIAIN